MELLYRYLAGDEFCHRLEAMVETFTAMEAQLSRERRARRSGASARRLEPETRTEGDQGLVGLTHQLRGLVSCSPNPSPTSAISRPRGSLSTPPARGGTAQPWTGRRWPMLRFKH